MAGLRGQGGRELRATGPSSSAAAPPPRRSTRTSASARTPSPWTATSRCRRAARAGSAAGPRPRCRRRARARPARDSVAAAPSPAAPRCSASRSSRCARLGRSVAASARGVDPAAAGAPPRRGRGASSSERPGRSARRPRPARPTADASAARTAADSARSSRPASLQCRGSMPSSRRSSSLLAVASWASTARAEAACSRRRSTGSIPSRTASPTSRCRNAVRLPCRVAHQQVARHQLAERVEQAGVVEVGELAQHAVGHARAVDRHGTGRGETVGAQRREPDAEHLGRGHRAPAGGADRRRAPRGRTGCPRARSTTSAAVTGVQADTRGRREVAHQHARRPRERAGSSATTVASGGARATATPTGRPASVSRWSPSGRAVPTTTRPGGGWSTRRVRVASVVTSARWRSSRTTTSGRTAASRPTYHGSRSAARPSVPAPAPGSRSGTSTARSARAAPAARAAGSDSVGRHGLAQRHPPRGGAESSRRPGGPLRGRRRDRRCAPRSSGARSSWGPSRPATSRDLPTPASPSTRTRAGPSRSARHRRRRSAGRPRRHGRRAARCVQPPVAPPGPEPRPDGGIRRLEVTVGDARWTAKAARGVAGR